MNALGNTMACSNSSNNHNNNSNSDAVMPTEDTDVCSSDETSVVAGTLRTVLNRALKLFSNEHSNKLFSKKMLTKVISKSQIHDVSEHYSAIKSEAQQHYYKKSSAASSEHRRGSTTTTTTVLKTIGFATVYILKSIVLGGAVFTMYEHSWHRLEIALSPQIDSEQLGMVSISPGYYMHVLHPSLLSTVSGFLAGASHGGLYCAMKRFVDQPLSRLQVGTQSLKQTPTGIHGSAKPMPRLTTTMLSHSFVYATLFGVYDFTKQNSLFALKSHNSIVAYNYNYKLSHEMEGILSVIMGATVAGIASEMINSLTHPLEIKKLRSVWQQGHSGASYFNFKKHFRGSYFRGLVPGIGSTIVGFLAYEYAKQFFDGFVINDDS
jgi:hypothetical protein